MFHQENNIVIKKKNFTVLFTTVQTYAYLREEKKMVKSQQASAVNI